MYSSQIHYLLSDFDSIGYDPFESWILKCASIENKFFMKVCYGKRTYCGKDRVS